MIRNNGLHLGEPRPSQTKLSVYRRSVLPEPENKEQKEKNRKVSHCHTLKHIILLNHPPTQKNNKKTHYRADSSLNGYNYNVLLCGVSHPHKIPGAS